MNPKIKKLLEERKEYQQIVERAAISIHGVQADIFERTAASVTIYSIDQEIEYLFNQERIKKRMTT